MSNKVTIDFRLNENGMPTRVFVTRDGKRTEVSSDYVEEGGGDVGWKVAETLNGFDIFLVYKINPGEEERPE